MAAIKPILCNLPMLPPFPISNGDYRMKRETPKGNGVGVEFINGKRPGVRLKATRIKRPLFCHLRLRG